MNYDFGILWTPRLAFLWAMEAPISSLSIHLANLSILASALQVTKAMIQTIYSKYCCVYTDIRTVYTAVQRPNFNPGLAAGNPWAKTGPIFGN